MTETPTTPDPADALVGRVVLGRYRIIRSLGKGGTGVVHFGRTEGAAGFAKPVVIKRVLPQLLRDSRMSTMLVREARILANLQHRGIVGVVDLGEEQGAYIMVLEYVHGYDLGQWLKYLRNQNRKLPIDVSLEIGIRVLEALHYAHTLIRADGVATEVIHRDISPANILLDTEGNVRILDFGIARIANDMAELATQRNTFKGKVGYSHPSLLELGEPTALTDTYSAALVTFQLLAGINPFYGTSTADTIKRVRNEPPPKLRGFRPEATPELEAVFIKALAKKTADGFQSAQQLADALRAQQKTATGEVSAVLTELVRLDFTGAMPGILGIESLAERDAAWRSVEKALRNSQRPKVTEDELTPVDARPVQRRMEFASDEPTAFQGQVRHPVGHEDETVVGLPGAPPGQPPRAIEEEPARAAVKPSLPTKGSHRALVLALGFVAAAIAAVAVALIVREQPKDPEARYLIISQDQPPSEAATAAAGGIAQPPVNAAASTAPESVSSSKGTQPEPASAKPRPRPPSEAQVPSAALFTRTFASKQSQIQGCFARAANPSKDVRVDIRFQIAASGAVSQAALNPSNLSSTPLGQCLLRVARATHFGLLTEPASVRIPVTASMQ